jgi:Regulator of chromosome condensation (RCC1) repeat
VKLLAQKKMTDVSCGENHTVAITDLGEIYSWGAGQFGQLGHGDILRQCSPMKIAVLEEKIIIQVSAGRKHSAALTANGHVYTWGSNEYGQLGLKNLGNVHAKKPSQVFPDKLYPAYSARVYIHGSPNIVDVFATEKNSEEKTEVISETDNLTFSPINQFPLKLPPDINRRSNFQIYF